MNRGEFSNQNIAKQLISYSGMVYGNISPTDLDGYIEYKDIAYVLFEVKQRGKEVSGGQRLALERMAKDFGKSGKQAVVFIADHEIYDPSQNIVLADCKVREIYFSTEKVWRPPRKVLHVKDGVNEFFNHILKDKGGKHGR